MKTWTKEEVKNALPEIISVTKKHHNNVRDLKTELDEEKNSDRVQKLHREIEFEFREWVREIRHIGGDVKGPWIVDFDAGDGIFYCWRYGEEELLFYHRYEDGLKDRKPIED